MTYESELGRWRANEIGELTDRELLIAGAVAYWAEGAKSKPWRPAETVRFMNSDAAMVQLFLRWLELNDVDTSRIRFQVHIHESPTSKRRRSTGRHA